MATVSAKVYDHHKKADGTYNVKICVYHKNERKFFDTSHYVSKKQLDSKLRIKDKFILDLLDEPLRSYRATISQLGNKLELFSAEELRNFLRDKDSDIDFLKFCNNHIERLMQVGRTGTARNHNAIVNSLSDYFGRKAVSIDEINSSMLLDYKRYLKTERTMVRVNQLGKAVKTTENGLSESGLYNHMRDLRTLFNAARNWFNNEDLGIIRIKHYPFKKYKIGSAPLTKKRNITVNDLIKIRDCQVAEGGRAELARDLFLLSFYLCGINAVDIYNLPTFDIASKRLDYNRAKTSGVRKDDAFISIKVVKEAIPHLVKYAGKLNSRYSTYNGLDSALSKGMHELRKITEIDSITFYWARHTFANLARNKCRLSKDDVALALNHVDEGHRTTDIYIEKDWDIVDDVQAKVIALIKKEARATTNNSPRFVPLMRIV